MEGSGMTSDAVSYLRRKEFLKYDCKISKLA
jgi:hypothetical protein